MLELTLSYDTFFNFFFFFFFGVCLHDFSEEKQMLRNSSFCRFSGVFVNMGLTFQKADAQADLDWWSHNHGMSMPQNWPMFEVH